VSCRVAANYRLSHRAERGQARPDGLDRADPPAIAGGGAGSAGRAFV